MISLRNIASVAKYERKTLFRSWFFRIFSILTLLILFGVNMGIFAENGARWTNRAIPSILPLVNVLFINVAQSIIAVFLASDFIRRDKKLDTTEVIYARPVSNGEYVAGKTIGILQLFIGLVFLVLSMGLLFNLVLKDTPVVWTAYLFYPLLISLPSLVFILGLSFFMMILFRNQAVTFVVLLGYIGLTIFYFKDKLHGLLDYMAFNLPMVYSDLIHFADLPNILLQRSAYLLLGIGFIFATIRFLGRLPQVGKWNGLNLAGFIIFLAAGLFAGYTFLAGFSRQEKDRTEFLALNNAFAGKAVPDIISNSLDLSQYGNSLTISSELMIRNQNEGRLDTLIFTLNPGFKIDSITGESGPLHFERDRQILLVFPENGLDQGRRMRCRIFYHGVPLESISYLDIHKKKLASQVRIQVATLDRKPGIVKPDFMLLTSELFWYPVAGVGFNLKNFQPQEMDFVRYSISLKPGKGLRAVAPGRSEEKDGIQRFRPDADLPVFPLVIGPFEKRSIRVDNVEYNLFLKPDHDYFSGFFPTLPDTLGALIKEAKEDYEYDELDLYYAFKRVNLVEVPIQFHPYERAFSQLVEWVQPEMILLPEKGAGLNTLDFKRFKLAEENRNKERDNARTPEEIEIDLFKNFIEHTFFQDALNAGGGFRRGGEDLIMLKGKKIYSRNPFCAFPLFYNYVTGISSADYPVFNSMIELYLKDGFEISPRDNFRGGITDSEKANLALKDKSLIDIFRKKNTELINATIYQAGSFIITALKNKVGMKEFDNFLYYYLEDHAFTEISFERFENDFKADFGVDIAPYLEFIKSGSQMPEFLFSTPEFYLTRDDYGDVYVIRMSISNKGGSTGLVDLTFRMPGQGGFGGGSNLSTEHRLFEIEAGMTKEIQMLFYDQPRLLTVNTLVSGNIPSSFSIFLRSATPKTISRLEDYTRDTKTIMDPAAQGEIVVDNEDAGFYYVSVSNESKIKQYIDSKKEVTDDLNYQTINPYWSQAIWTPVVHSGMYGQTIRSAIVSRKGDGQNIARWTTVLPKAGFYDLYVYIPVSSMYKGPSSRGGGGDRRGGGEGNRPRGPEFADKGTDYHYTVSSNEGSEEVIFPLNFPDDGWNRLGTFHFPADTAHVELSNSTNGKRVIADAVKWVARD